MVTIEDLKDIRVGLGENRGVEGKKSGLKVNRGVCCLPPYYPFLFSCFSFSCCEDLSTATAGGSFTGKPSPLHASHLLSNFKCKLPVLCSR